MYTHIHVYKYTISVLQSVKDYSCTTIFVYVTRLDSTGRFIKICKRIQCELSIVYRNILQHTTTHYLKNKEFTL